MNFKVFLDVEPDGKLYGFPKQVPDHLIKYFGGLDYELHPAIRKWASEEEGYPKVNGKNVRFKHWLQKIDE